MPSAKAILIQSAVIVGIGAAIGLGDLINRGGGVSLKLGAGGGDEKIADLLSKPPVKPAPEPEADPKQPVQEPEEPARSTDATPTEPTPAPAPAAAPPTAVNPAATIDCASMDPPPHWPESHITVAKAHALYETGQVVFVDARIEQDYIAGHIPNAHFLPVSAFEGGFPDRVMFQMDPSAVTILYCSGGEDCEAAEDVAVELKAAGFTALRILHDGMPGWIACGHPVQAGEDPNAF